MPISKKDRHRQQEAWKKDNTTRVVIRLNHHTDADILAHLKAKDNTQGYIKSLIRADIAREQQEKPET